MTPFVINCRFLTQPTTGVQRFAENISLELKKLMPDALFVAPNNIINNESADKLGVQIIGRNRGHVWEQYDLPYFLATQDNPLLLSLGNTGPIFYRNQIATLHDITFIRFPQSFSFPFRMLYGLQFPLLIRHCRALLTVSEFSKSEISRKFRFDSNRMHVIANAADARFSPRKQVNAEKPYLLAVSSTNYHKNFRRVIEAYSAWEKKEGINLRIVGGTSGSFAKQDYGNVPVGIEFIGRVDDEQLVGLYSNALGFIFPSLYEGFGIPPLEAQACGCPVIASYAASIPEVLGDSAIYFDPNDVNDIKRAMDALICSPEQRDIWVKKGLKNAHRFTWEQSARKLFSVVREILSP